MSLSVMEVKPNYFSTIECHCNCGNLLPQRNVDLGHRYLRGHKPPPATITRKKMLKDPVQRAAPVTTFSVDNSLKIFREELTFITDQYERNVAESERLTLTIERLLSRKTSLEKIVEEAMKLS